MTSQDQGFLQGGRGGQERAREQGWSETTTNLFIVLTHLFLQCVRIYINSTLLVIYFDENVLILQQSY